MISDQLKKRLPMTINMSELAGNEKYCYIDQALPTESEAASRIQAGDLMLYGSDCLVLFYKTFDTPYRYIRLGKVDDPQDLASALGSGSVKLKIEIKEKS